MSLKLNLPDTWISTHLPDVALLNMGQSPSSADVNTDGNGYAFFQGKAEFGMLHPVARKYCTVPKKIAEKDDILLSVRAPVGPTNLADQTTAIGRGLAAIRPVTGLDVKYLLHYFRAIEPWLSEQGTGSTFKAISGQFLKELPVAVAPFAEQKQIAAKLDELLAQVDTIKTRLDAIPAILKRFRQSVLATAVSGRLTEEWRGSVELHDWVCGVLGDFVKKPSYGTSAKSQKEGAVPVLRMGNLQDGKLDWSDLVYTSDPAEIEKYRLQSGDVLFNRTNSPELVGKTSIYRGEREAIYAGYLIRVQCTEELNPEFLNYHLNSPGAKDYCRSVKSDGVSQSNINAKKLVAYSLSKPPKKEQNEIVRRVEQYFTFADQIEQRVKDAQSRVNHLTQSILAKAFRGELTAEWREQNPDLISGENSAQALLERIKAESQSVSKKERSRK